MLNKSYAKDYINERLVFFEYVPATKKEIVKPKTITIGDLFIDPYSRYVTLAGKRKRMDGKTFDVFYAIAKRKGICVTHPRLMRECFTEKRYSRSRAWVSSSVKQVRKVMGDDFILSCRGEGYSLNSSLLTV